MIAAVDDDFAGAKPGRELTVRAPGRVNLIGEHTDYNDGFVLPAAIDLELRIAFVPTSDRSVTLISDGATQPAHVSLDNVGSPRHDWTDYMRGVAWSLGNAGWPVGGFRGRLTGTLPSQAGLSSSAALELAAAWALMASTGPASAGDSIDRLALARLCQRAENEYVGVKSGLMDQFAVASGLEGHAVLLDCRSFDYRAVRIPDGIALVVVDTGVRRRLVASEYNARRAECERGVAVLAARGEPVEALRDANVEMLERGRDQLGELIYRRCRHVVEENARTLDTVAALENTDRPALSELFAASHASLRELYEVSSPALDAAVDIANATPGVIAARMTGAGFGGCTINLVEDGEAGRLRSAIERDYGSRTGLAAQLYEVTAANGAGVLAEPPVR